MTVLEDAGCCERERERTLIKVSVEREEEVAVCVLIKRGLLLLELSWVAVAVGK